MFRPRMPRPYIDRRCAGFVFGVLCVLVAACLIVVLFQQERSNDLLKHGQSTMGRNGPSAVMIGLSQPQDILQ